MPMEEVSFDNLDNPDNSGTSGSGTFILRGDWGPARAFIRQKSRTREYMEWHWQKRKLVWKRYEEVITHPWMSMPANTFPTTVYYQFGKKTTIVKFGFRNRRAKGKHVAKLGCENNKAREETHK